MLEEYSKERTSKETLLEYACLRSRGSKTTLSNDSEKKLLFEYCQNNPNNVILLLDGYDEISSRTTNDAILADINDLSTKFILTTRKYGIHISQLRKDISFEMQPFDWDDQIKMYINNWSNIYPDNFDKDTAIKYLDNNINVRTIVKNPLLLALFCYIRDDPAETPITKSEFYDTTINRMLRRNPKITDKSPLNGVSDAELDLLQAIANNAMELFSYKSFVGELREGYPDVVNLKFIIQELLQAPDYNIRSDSKINHTEVSYIIFNSGIVSAYNGDINYYHPTFREFLTALYLSELENGLDIIKNHIRAPEWREVIVFYTGLLDNADPLIKYLLDRDNENISYSNLQLAWHCLSEIHPTCISSILRSKITNDIFSLIWNDNFKYLGLGYKINTFGYLTKDILDRIEAMVYMGFYAKSFEILGRYPTLYEKCSHFFFNIFVSNDELPVINNSLIKPLSRPFIMPKSCPNRTIDNNSTVS